MIIMIIIIYLELNLEINIVQIIIIIHNKCQLHMQKCYYNKDMEIIIIVKYNKNNKINKYQLRKC